MPKDKFFGSTEFKTINKIFESCALKLKIGRIYQNAL